MSGLITASFPTDPQAGWVYWQLNGYKDTSNVNFRLVLESGVDTGEVNSNNISQRINSNQVGIALALDYSYENTNDGIQSRFRMTQDKTPIKGLEEFSPTSKGDKLGGTIALYHYFMPRTALGFYVRSIDTTYRVRVWITITGYLAPYNEIMENMKVPKEWAANK